MKFESPHSQETTPKYLDAVKVQRQAIRAEVPTESFKKKSFDNVDTYFKILAIPSLTLLMYGCANLEQKDSGTLEARPEQFVEDQHSLAFYPDKDGGFIPSVEKKIIQENPSQENTF